MKSGKWFLGILAGAGVGALLATLFAPRTGKNTRKEIANTGKKFADSIKETFRKSFDSIAEKIQKAKEDCW